LVFIIYPALKARDIAGTTGRNKKALAALLSGEQAERKKLMDQMAALAARLDSLVTALDNLKISRGEIAEPSTLEAPAAAKRIGRRGRR